MTMIDHDEREPMGEPEPVADSTETIAPQPGMSGSPLYEASKLVPVERHGAAPATLEHQITYAQYMAKAKLSVPAHLHGNIGDCLAVIDIATRAGLSPYMLAQKTYAQGGKLSFESQLFHALLIQSGRLYGAGLNKRYEGEGPDRICIVWGHLKGDAEPKQHRSEKLSKMHPGYSFKNDDGPTKSTKALSYAEGQAILAEANRLIAEAIEAGAQPPPLPNLFVKGSPLWDDKPDVQQFYDASRDWIRMFCPVATLGILDFYEIIEHPLPPQTNLVDRLQTGNKAEGHQNGHAAEELARTAADNATLKPAGAGTGNTEPTKIKPAKAEGKKGSDKPPADQKRTISLEKDKAPTRRQTTAAADRAQASSDARKREADEKKAAAAAKKPEQKTDDPPPVVPVKPTNDAEYNVYCRDWIDKTADPEAALKRWDHEYEMRDNLVVRVPTRNALREYLEKKHGV